MRRWGVVSYHDMTLIGTEIGVWYLFVDIFAGISNKSTASDVI